MAAKGLATSDTKDGQEMSEAAACDPRFAQWRNQFDAQPEYQHPFVERNVNIKAYRIGALDSPHGRGIFLSADHWGAESYTFNHPGQEVKAYQLSLGKVLICGHQNTASQFLVNKTYCDLSHGKEPGVKFDSTVARAAKKQGYDAIIYTHPAPPADYEVVIFDKKLAKPI